MLDFSLRSTARIVALTTLLLLATFVGAAGAATCPDWMYDTNRFAERMNAIVDRPNESYLERNRRINALRIENELSRPGAGYRRGEDEGQFPAIPAYLNRSIGQESANLTFLATRRPNSLAILNVEAERAGMNHQSWTPGEPGNDGEFFQTPAVDSRLRALFAGFSQGYQEYWYGPNSGAMRVSNPVPGYEELERQLRSWGLIDPENLSGPTAGDLLAKYREFLDESNEQMREIRDATARVERLRQRLFQLLGCDDEGPGGSGRSCSAMPRRIQLPDPVNSALRSAQDETLRDVNANRAANGGRLLTQEDLDRIIQGYESSPGSLDGTAYFRGVAEAPGRGIAQTGFSAIGAGAIPAIVNGIRSLAPAGGVGIPAAAGVIGGPAPASPPAIPGMGAGAGSLPIPSSSSRPMVPRSRPRSSDKPTSEKSCRYVGTERVRASSPSDLEIRTTDANVTFISKCYSDQEAISPDDFLALYTARSVHIHRNTRDSLRNQASLDFHNMVVGLTFSPSGGAKATASRRATAADRAPDRPAPANSDASDSDTYRAWPAFISAPLTISVRTDPPSPSTETEVSGALSDTIQKAARETRVEIDGGLRVLTPNTSPVQLQRHPC